MTKKIFCLALGALLLVLCLPAEAQQPGTMPRIGYLRVGAVATPTPRAGLREQAFLQGLRELGYVEGENIIIEYRVAGSRLDQLRELARQLVQLKVDVIVAVATPAVEAARDATQTIPIVMSGGAPVRSGLVASLARPGGNITGLSNLTPELAGKRLELLKEIVPRLSRVSVLWTPDVGLATLGFKEIETAANLLSVQIHSAEARVPRDLESAFAAMKRERAEALVTLRSPVIASHTKQIVDLAAGSRLPGMYDDRSFARAGGLVSYGVDLAHLDRRAAFYVDKILKGAKPADLPIEQPRKFELVINLKTARRIGLAIPATILMWADDVIK